MNLDTHTGTHTVHFECPYCGEVSEFDATEDSETGYLQPMNGTWECPLCRKEWC